MWVRGLKLDLQYVYLTVLHVAPRVGAWIETLVRIVCFIWSSVAPRVGAWIETFVKRKLFHKRYTYLRDEVYLLWDLKCSSATKRLVLRKNNFLKSLTLTYNFA